MNQIEEAAANLGMNVDDYIRFMRGLPRRMVTRAEVDAMNALLDDDGDEEE